MHTSTEGPGWGFHSGWCPLADAVDPAQYPECNPAVQTESKNWASKLQCLPGNLCWLRARERSWAVSGDGRPTAQGRGNATVTGSVTKLASCTSSKIILLFTWKLWGLLFHLKVYKRTIMQPYKKSEHCILVGDSSPVCKSFEIAHVYIPTERFVKPGSDLQKASPFVIT